ncbi:uncharacterized protein LOC124205568 [Daphnia pulex]|uniref:uncharacterized protein LOC124205568 n=1 Tax=Daphnia pulex TaxID=6669 RepID=UPI001EDE0F93|nr:uncharacterized protein LOC124205568 [Daphnia pulex]
MIDRDRKEVEASVKFPTQSIPSILKDFSQKVTRYAFELVNQQMKLSKTGYSIIETDSSFQITSGTSNYCISRDLSRCSCTFFANYRLPCRHLLFICVEENLTLSSNCYDACRNQCSSNEESFEVPKDGNTVSPISVFVKQRHGKVVTREYMWNAANKLSKEWCNAVQDLPLPAFQGQMNLMNKMLSGAKNCHVVSFDMSNGASVDVSDDVTEQLTPSTSKSSTVSRKGKALKKKSLDDSASTSVTSPPNKKIVFRVR